MFSGPVKLAPYLVYQSPDIAGERLVREYEGAIAGDRSSVSCSDTVSESDVIEPDGTVWCVIGTDKPEWEEPGVFPEGACLERKW